MMLDSHLRGGGESQENKSEQAAALAASLYHTMSSAATNSHKCHAYGAAALPFPSAEEIVEMSRKFCDEHREKFRAEAKREYEDELSLLRDRLREATGTVEDMKEKNDMLKQQNEALRNETKKWFRVTLAALVMAASVMSAGRR